MSASSSVMRAAALCSPAAKSRPSLSIASSSRAAWPTASSAARMPTAASPPLPAPIAACGCGELLVGESDALACLRGVVGDGGERLGGVGRGERAQLLRRRRRWMPRPARAAPARARATRGRSARAGAARRMRRPSRRGPALASSQSRMISVFHDAGLLFGVGRRVVELLLDRERLVEVLASRSAGPARTRRVAASPNCARANPSSCSLVLTASSVSHEGRRRAPRQLFRRRSARPGRPAPTVRRPSCGGCAR